MINGTGWSRGVLGHETFRILVEEPELKTST